MADMKSREYDMNALNYIHLYQVECICLDDLVPKNHFYRSFEKIADLESIDNILIQPRKRKSKIDYNMNILFRCIVLQMIEDVSYIELEKLLEENVIAKWFCHFSLQSSIPKHKELELFPEYIGSDLTVNLLSELKDRLKEQGHTYDFLATDKAQLAAQRFRWNQYDEGNRNKLKFLGSF